MKNIISKVLRIAAIASLVLMLAALMSACSSNESAQTKIVSVSINKDGSTVKLEASFDAEYSKTHSGETRYVLALSTAETDSIPNDATPIGEIKVKESVSLKLGLYGDDGSSRLTQAFVIAEYSNGKYVAITDAVYINNPSAIAPSTNDVGVLGGFKGLSSNDIYAAEYLGASQILLEADIDGFLHAGHSEATLKYNHDGSSYYFDREKVGELDRLVGSASDMGMRVVLRTTLKHPEKSKNNGSDGEKEPISELYCKKAASGAIGYVPNMEDRAAAEYISAFYSFLSSRYSGEYGTVSGYIIGENVNRYGEYCNAGAADSEKFESIYAAWVRNAYLTVRSCGSNAEIYVPVSNDWRVDGTDGVIGAEAFLSRLASGTRKSGDYDYSIALNLGSGSDLSAVLSGTSAGYSRIGASNLNDFVSLMDSTSMRYKSERRGYIIDGLSLSPDVSEKNRAAYFTYAYYRAASLGFDAFIYSGELTGANVARSDMYYCYLMCGSVLNSQLSDYTQRLTNVEIPSFGDYAERKLSYEQNAKLELGGSVLKNKKAFPAKLDSFEEGGAVYNAHIELKSGKQTLRISSDASDTVGAVSSFEVESKDIVSSGYVGITMSTDRCPRVALMISDGSGKHIAYVGETETVNAETTYYFDISEFSKNVSTSDKLTVSVCILPDKKGEHTVEISEIALYGSSGGGVQTAVIIACVAVGIAVFGVLIFVLVKKRKKKIDSAD